MSIYYSLNSENHYPRCLKDKLLNLNKLDSKIKHIKSSNYEKKFNEEGKLIYIKSWNKTSEYKYYKNGKLEEIKVTNWDSREREFSRYDFINFNYLETEDNYRIVIINDDCTDNRGDSIEIIDYFENNGIHIEEHRVYNVFHNTERVLPKYVIENSNQLIINNGRLDRYYKHKKWEFEITNLIIRIYDKSDYGVKEKDEDFVNIYYLGFYSKNIFDINDRCIEHTESYFDENKLPYLEDSFFLNTENIDSDYLEEFYYFFTSGSLSDTYLNNNIHRKIIYTYDEKNSCFAEIFESNSLYKKKNLVFDNNKKLIQNCIVYNDGEEIMELFKYDEFGNITKISKVNGKFEDVYHYEYDANNKWIKKFKNNKLLIERQVEYYILDNSD